MQENCQIHKKWRIQISNEVIYWFKCERRQHLTIQ